LFNSNLGISVGAFDAVTAGVAIGSASMVVASLLLLLVLPLVFLVLVFGFLEKCF
jgi:hypothetical protein